jgi:hypothetical protein
VAGTQPEILFCLLFVVCCCCLSFVVRRLSIVDCGSTSPPPARIHLTAFDSLIAVPHSLSFSFPESSANPTTQREQQQQQPLGRDTDTVLHTAETPTH